MNDKIKKQIISDTLIELKKIQTDLHNKVCEKNCSKLTLKDCKRCILNKTYMAIDLIIFGNT